MLQYQREKESERARERERVVGFCGGGRVGPAVGPGMFLL